MTTENTLTLLNSIHSDLKVVKELVYDKCGFDLTNLKQNIESKEYGACTFELNGKTIQQRVSKITPTKTGQFVTIWKRNDNGITEPFDSSDDFDFVIITARNDNSFGQFIFPKSVLADKAIITHKGKEGKRGIRVYPPWDITTNKQAEKTQNWQTKYFLTIKNDNSNDLDLTKKLLSQTSENV
ncbi:MAG: MepB family protein [Saprospiraceae bacterium]|nr:MepB family protein [Candidatus Defluviibacterium haderslevense]